MRPLPAQATTARLAIGAKLRSARNTQRLTLEQLANATGLSRSFISRIENDATSPSITTLVQICQVLSIPIGSLFTEPETQHITLEAAPPINMGAVDATERLVTSRGESRAQVIHTKAGPGAHGGHTLYTINSELEILHVIDGSATVTFADHAVDLATGDTLSFSGHEPHTWHAGDEGATLIWTLIPAAWSGSS